MLTHFELTVIFGSFLNDLIFFRRKAAKLKVDIRTVIKNLSNIKNYIYIYLLNYILQTWKSRKIRV